MEVQLRKTKITKSILNQIQSSGFTHTNPNNVLGWAFDGKNRYILFYNKETNQLHKYPLNIRTRIIATHRIEVSRPGYINVYYQCNSKEAAIELESNFNISVYKANKLGQIFI